MTASTAIRAKGTLIKIATGAGSAKAISGVTVGNPTILTITAHGFSLGNRIDIAGLGGADAALLNVSDVAVAYKTTNTIAVPIDTTGKTITFAGSPTATSHTYDTIGNAKDFQGFDGSNSEIPVTHFGSDAVEVLSGLPDNGQFMCNIDLDNSNAGQAAAEAARLTGDVTAFQVVLPGGTTPTASFVGFVKKFDRKGAVNNVVQGSIQVRITGAVTWA